MYRVSGVRQGRYGRFEIVPGQEQVVGVVGGEGKDADTGQGQGLRQRLEDARLREIQGAGDAETPESPLGFRVRGDSSLQADDGELRRGARDRNHRSALGPHWNLGVRPEPRDRVGLRKQFQGEATLL